METNKSPGYEKGKVKYLHTFGKTVINIPTEGKTLPLYIKESIREFYI